MRRSSPSKQVVLEATQRELVEPVISLFLSTRTQHARAATIECLAVQRWQKHNLLWPEEGYGKCCTVELKSPKKSAALGSDPIHYWNAIHTSMWYIAVLYQVELPVSSSKLHCSMYQVKSTSALAGWAPSTKQYQYQYSTKYQVALHWQVEPCQSSSFFLGRLWHRQGESPDKGPVTLDDGAIDRNDDDDDDEKITGTLDQCCPAHGWYIYL